MAFPLSDEEHCEIEDRIDGQVELVVAAAVRFDGATISFARPARHGECINWLSHHGLRAENRQYDCGFVTNKGRFVGREEAGRIVLANDQGAPGGNPENNPRMSLFSEDMWNDTRSEPRGPINPRTIFSLTGSAQG